MNGTFLIFTKSLWRSKTINIFLLLVISCMAALSFCQIHTLRSATKPKERITSFSFGFHPEIKKNRGNAFALMEKKDRKSASIPPGHKRENIGSGSPSPAETPMLWQIWGTSGGIIMLASFIVFAVMNLEIEEKRRLTGLLRCLGISQSQIGLLGLSQAGFLGTAGGVIGIFLGYLYLKATGKTGILPPEEALWAFGVSVAFVLLSAIIPAWRAACFSPHEVMIRRPLRFSRQRIAIIAVAALFLLAFLPFISWWPAIPAIPRIVLFSTAGSLAFLIGTMTLLICTLHAIEHLFSPVFSAIFRLPQELCRQLLTANRLRSILTMIPLTGGLVLYTALLIWSSSMLTMFQVPKEIPEIFVRFQKELCTEECRKQMEACPEIAQEQCHPVSLAQPSLAACHLAPGAMAQNVVCMGIDLEKAFYGENPFLHLKILEKENDSLLPKDEIPCVIPETLAKQLRLHAGDFLWLGNGSRHRFKTPETGETPLRITAVVRFSWSWFSKCSGVRVRSPRTAAIIFVPYEFPIQQYDAPPNEAFWINLKANADPTQFRNRVLTLSRTMAEKIPVFGKSYSGGTRWDSGINKNHVQISSRRELNKSLFSRTDHVLSLMKEMPKQFLFLATLALAYTCILSLLQRKKEFHLLFLCGATPSIPLRIAMMEQVLFWLAATVTALPCGVLYAASVTHLADYAPSFGVTAPPLVIHIAEIFLPYLYSLGICLFIPPALFLLKGILLRLGMRNRGICQTARPGPQ